MMVARVRYTVPTVPGDDPPRAIAGTQDWTWDGPMASKGRLSEGRQDVSASGDLRYSACHGGELSPPQLFVG